LRHLVLYGEHELTIDDKNRLLVPSDVRKQIDPARDGEAFFLVIGTDGRLCLYPERHYEALVSRDPSELTPDLDTLAYDRMNLGMASRIEWDKQGRVLLPDRVLKRAGVGKDVTLVGVRDHLELWQRSEWEAERDALENRRAELALKARQARQTPQ
jgi:MraZ protein